MGIAVLHRLHLDICYPIQHSELLVTQLIELLFLGFSSCCCRHCFSMNAEIQVLPSCCGTSGSPAFAPVALLLAAAAVMLLPGHVLAGVAAGHEALHSCLKTCSSCSTALPAATSVAAAAGGFPASL
jgi:hypothetical protein